MLAVPGPLPMTTSRGLSPTRQKLVIKPAISTPNIRKVATAAPRQVAHVRLGSESLSTLRDPRSTGDLREAAAAGDEYSIQHPDYNPEVAALSHKLIGALNHQSRLDDSLATAKEELRQTQEKLKQAEARNVEWDTLLRDRRLVRKLEYDETVNDVLRRLNSEKKARDLAEREKRAIEMELADLSTKLFEEANELVSKARRETEAAENRTEQVRGQLTDAESLLASQQEQLAQLKAILERNTDAETETAASTAPSTPAMGASAFDRGPETPQFANGDSAEPGPPLSFTHIILPALRCDVPAFEDFKALLQINRQAASQPTSRVTSGTYGGLNIPGTLQSPTPTNGSQTNLGANASQPHSPSNSSSTMPGSLSGSMYSPTSYLPLLRETKFFKRALAEDIDPTLRLDVAPGLSYFNRRSVSSAINDNTLMLDPAPSATKKLITSCTLCGERRRGDKYARTHRFKTGDDSAQWYPLCAFCVTRFRSVCDYIAFLRMIRDGFWRCDTKEAEEKAWEESVRLRERMFWARVGGGVVPVGSSSKDDTSSDSQRTSLDVEKRLSKESAIPVTEVTAAQDATALPTPSDNAEGDDPMKTAPEANGDGAFEALDIRELPSTAPPLQATMLPASDSSSSRQLSSDSTSSDTMTSPMRISFTDSLKRISFRDSLRFGSRSRNASTERGIATPNAAASPRLNAVDETEAPENIEEINEKQPPALDREDSDGLNIRVPGGF